MYEKLGNISVGGMPGRIVIPSEEDIRDVRQIPFEIDPPLHTDFRKMLDSWFKRPLQAEYQERLRHIVNALLNRSMRQDKIEVVHHFALVLQSQALTLLLNMPVDEADEYISWGLHVFRSKESSTDKTKASQLDEYILGQIEQAVQKPGDDFFSQLLAAKVNGQKLTKEEVRGIMNLTFAGGRDTVINSVTNSIAYFAEHPQAIKQLRNNPRTIPLAIEEFIRYFSPLTHLGRIVSQDTEICGHAIKANSKISLG